MSADGPAPCDIRLSYAEPATRPCPGLGGQTPEAIRSQPMSEGEVLPPFACREVRATFGSGTDENLECRSAGHGAVTVGHVVQADGAVEHPAWLDPPVEHIGQQFLDVGAGGTSGLLA